MKERFKGVSLDHYLSSPIKLARIERGQGV
jgi:hypothetical protein